MLVAVACGTDTPVDPGATADAATSGTYVHGDDPLPKVLVEHGVPVVMAGRPPGTSDVSFVDADNRGGARLATQHLLRLGRRRVATITGPQDMPVGVDRLEGYREALVEAEIEPDGSLVESGDFSQASGSRAMRALLAREPDLDGLFAASDLMAVGTHRLVLGTELVVSAST